LRKSLAFIDTETTGLDPVVHEVIEIAVIRVRPGGGVDRYHTRIKPEHLEVAEDVALEVNGYAANPSLWDDAPLLKDIASDLAMFLAGCILVGHNVSYDEAMLKGVFKRAGVPLSIPHRKIDTITLCYEHLYPMGLDSVGLDSVREYLGWSLEGGHTAMRDVEDAMRLYYLLNQASALTRFKIYLGAFRVRR
jgi:DNA polymerase III alpha subunit (gram-positive type)